MANWVDEQIRNGILSSSHSKGHRKYKRISLSDSSSPGIYIARVLISFIEGIPSIPGLITWPGDLRRVKRVAKQQQQFSRTAIQQLNSHATVTFYHAIPMTPES
jgi:hypothetical protein